MRRLQRRGALCLIATAALRARRLFAGQRPGRYHAAQRLLRPDARALPGVQRARSPTHWKAADRRGRHDPAVARRLGQAGARGDRRPRGRRRHARARRRHRRDRRAHGKLLPADWQTRLPDNSAPYTSTIVFLVRKGNPEGHQGLGRSGQAGRRGHHAEPEDLGRRALELPRRLGLCACRQWNGDEAKARDFVAAIYRNVPVLDTGARGSTTTFVAARHRRRAARLGERGASSRSRSSAPDKFEIVVPSLSILAEPPVAVVDTGRRPQGHARGRRGLPASTSTRRQAQEIAAKHYYRPRDPDGRRPSDLSQLPEGRSWSRSTTCSAAGRRRRRRTSPTAASSTRSTSRDGERARCARSRADAAERPARASG